MIVCMFMWRSISSSGLPRSRRIVDRCPLKVMEVKHINDRQKKDVWVDSLVSN